jgi:hypothetical protein
MMPAFDDPALYERLNDAGAEWIDGRTCRVALDQGLAQWLVKEAHPTGWPYSNAELEPYIEWLDEGGGRGSEPIRIYAGVRSIEDGSHRLHAVAAGARGYIAIIRVEG